MRLLTPRIGRFALNIWLHRFTGAGRRLMIAGFFATVIGGMSMSVPVYQVFAALAALAVLSLGLGLVSRRRMRIRGDFPERTIAGQPFRAVFRVENLSRRSLHDVGLGFFFLPTELRQIDVDVVAPVVPARGEVPIPIDIRPLKRGLYELPPIHVHSTFPFQLWRKTAAKRRVEPLLVLPAFHPLEGIDVPQGRLYQPGGVAFTSNVGESPEYVGNRDYRTGDPVRHIDFRAWSRLARPVVKEFQEEYYSRIALVLDTHVPRRRIRRAAGFPDLEAAVSLCAAIADSLSRGELLIDVFAAGPELYCFRAGRHVAHFENILDILACVDACRHNPFRALTPALTNELRNVTAAVYVMLDWDKSREDFVRAGLDCGAPPRVFVVRRGATSMPVGPSESWAGPIQVLRPEDVSSGQAVVQ